MKNKYEGNWKQQIESSFTKNKDYTESLLAATNESDEFLEIVTNLALTTTIGEFRQKINGILTKIESPIEKALFIALVTFSKHYAECIHFIANVNGFSFHYGDTPASYSRITIETQKPIGKYKVDFLIRYSEHVPDYENKRIINGEEYPGNAFEIRELIVECDGHDFHERTKEQASKDRKRDIFLQESGFRVYRFTGSDIWKDAAGCAQTILESLTDLEKRKTFTPKIVRLKE